MNTFLRYAVPAIATLIAFLLTRWFGELFVPMRLFFFWGTVLLTAFFAGVGPAVVAVGLSTIAAGALIAEGGTLTSTDILRLGLFAAFSGGISFAVGFRHRAEARAAVSELRYRTLVEANPLPQAVWTATPDGHVQWSDSWLTITGQTRQDVEAGGGLRVVHADDAQRTWTRWKAALESGGTYEDEIRVRVGDGSWRWFAIRAVPVTDDNRISEWIGIVADIDERKRHEQQSAFLNRASELLASSLDYEKTLRNLARLCVPALGDWSAIHLRTEDTNYERVVVEHSDPAQVRFVEQLDRSMRPKPEDDPIVKVMQSGRSHLVEHLPDELLATIAKTPEQMEAIRKMGFHSWIIAPMTTGGHTLGTLTVVHGESGRRYTQEDVPFIEDLARRAATAIENARLFEAADAANRAKDEFLATLSHELRTPLTSIAGWAHMLQLGVADEQTRRLAVDTIVRSARTQAELIDDLLDLSRVVAGTLQLGVTTVDLGSIVGDVLVAAKPAADAKGLAMQLDLDAPTVLVRGDDRRLRQVVWNLVSNAVKFTEAGGEIRVALSMHGRNARLEVIDTGRGIDASFLPHVWDRFRQADSSTSRQHGGLGLGLAVVRHLVELHGGTVSVESAGAGKGARFAIEIPLARLDCDATSTLDAVAKRDAPLRGRRVLVVDDDADARMVLTAMLRQQGADVLAADSVESALRAMESQSFNAVVSDIAMPGEDGYSLARRIRAQWQVPMIAVSAIAAGPDDRERALVSGFDEFVRKPVDPRQLAEVVRGAIATRNPRVE
jgi:PAS domain S-box-containing protein